MSSLSSQQEEMGFEMAVYGSYMDTVAMHHSHPCLYNLQESGKREKKKSFYCHSRRIRIVLVKEASTMRPGDTLLSPFILAITRDLELVGL